MWAAGPVWLITLLWWLATTLYVGAGLGVLGFSRYANYVVELAFAAVIPSALLIGSFTGLFVIPGILLDLGLLWAVLRLRDRAEPVPSTPVRYRGRWTTALALLFVIYTSGAILLRPWAMRMGTTLAERRAPLFGDSLHRGARYRVDNAITINAPADSVWPWVAQIGQDRGGFYSYDALERLFGDSLGWRIEAMLPGRAIVLEKWGAFVVQPIDSNRSRLYIRQRNPGTPSFVGNLLAPVGLLVFEPAHFIMQRGMLRGIKARVEGS
jgi:hypothetical protein